MLVSLSSVSKLHIEHSLTNSAWLVNFEMHVVDILYLPIYKNYLNHAWAAFFKIVRPC